MELLRIVEQRYDLGALQLRGRLEGGYANDVYLIEAAGEPYVLRVKHPPVHREIAWTQSAAAPTSPIHGDFFPGNVLVDGGRVTALLDWEEARVDWPAIDVAAGVWHFAAEDGRNCDRFLAAYADAGGFPPDRAVLTPLVRVKRVLEVLRAPTDRHVDWDYQCENLAAIERLPET